MEDSLKLFVCIVVFFCIWVDSRDVIGPDEDPYPIKPEKCLGTDEIMDAKCCVIPPFYVREVAKSCGTIFSVTFNDAAHNVSGFRRDALSCENIKCTLYKYGLLTPDDTLDEEKFYVHLDRWVGINPEFSDVMQKAKIHCKQQYKMYMPLKDCPIMIDSDICYQQKEFYNECREFFL